MRKLICLFLIFTFLSSFVVSAEELPAISAKSGLLMDADSGKILFEQNADEQLPIASTTKIMTMLLIMEAVDSGQISLDDIVTVSENGSFRTGSRIFLEIGEQISMHELLKGIAVASGNDAAIASAEYLCGSEEAFVAKMNQRAAELGLKNTHFVNCHGLDADNHYSSARDLAIISRELLKHPKILEYTTIWLDTIRNGKSEISNTNKLIRFYEGATGLKTGSTDQAGCCLVGTAKKNDIHLISVILGAPTTNDRFSDGKTLLNYGFSHFSRVDKCEKNEIYCEVPVKKGVGDTIPLAYRDSFHTVAQNGLEDQITEQYTVPELVEAPIKEGDVLGSVTFYENGQEIGRTDLIAAMDIDRISFGYLYKKALLSIF